MAKTIGRLRLDQMNAENRHFETRTNLINEYILQKE